MAPSAVGHLPSRDVQLLERYWREEPWGAWRDNLHAAIIAREVARPWLKKGRRPNLDDYLVMLPEHREKATAARQRAALASLVDGLKAMATKVRANDRPRKARRPARG